MKCPTPVNKRSFCTASSVVHVVIPQQSVVDAQATFLQIKRPSIILHVLLISKILTQK